MLAVLLITEFLKFMEVLNFACKHSLLLDENNRLLYRIMQALLLLLMRPLLRIV